MIKCLSMASEQRELIGIINNSVGGISALPCAYFWVYCAIFGFYHIDFNNLGLGLALVGMLVAVPLSAVAGTFGWRAWYFVTAISASSFLFFIFTHFVD